MAQLVGIIQKELKQLFYSPMAYIILFVTLGVFNAFFYLVIDLNAEASLRDIFKVMEFMFVFIIPMLTMRLIAEERTSGTFELLMTSPISNWTIIFGKFLGLLLFFLLFIALTVPYYVILEVFAQPDRGAILVGYIGILMEIMAFIAIGLFFSSLCKSQVVAAISSYVVIFMLYFSVSFMKYLEGAWAKVVRYTGLWSHSEGFINGVVQTQDIIYFISVVLFCLILTRASLHKR